MADTPNPEPRILLAEDDTELRRVLSYVLARRGYAVTATADGHETLVILSAISRGELPVPDAIVMDDAARNLLADLPRVDEAAALLLADRFRGGEGQAQFNLHCAGRCQGRVLQHGRAPRP